MVCLLHSACSAISDMVKYLLSIISRMRTNFEGESLGAMSPGLITVSGKLLCRKLQFAITQEKSGDTVYLLISYKIHHRWY